MVFRRSSWPRRRRLPYKRLFVATWQRSDPLSRLYSFDFWSAELDCAVSPTSGFPQASLLGGTGLQYQGSSSDSSETCSFLCVKFSCSSSFKPPRYASFNLHWDAKAASNELASNFPAARPSNRQGMHPLISIETQPLLHWSHLSCFWLLSAGMPEFSPFFTFSLHGCLCIWIFHCLRHRNEFLNKTNMSYRIRLLCSDVILMSFCVPSSLGLVLSSALAFSNIAVDSHPLLLICILQSIAAGIGTSNFLRAAFIMCLNSSSSGSMKYILLNCLALSIFDFSMAHFCFAFFFRCIRHMLAHIWPYIVWTRSWLFSC